MCKCITIIHVVMCMDGWMYEHMGGRREGERDGKMNG
jgi:hypothetical protein